MNEENLLKQLYFINDWWASGRVPESKLEQFKRRDFHFLKEALNKQEISAVVGPRQVGKTTLLYQVIDHLLTVQKISPTQIFFLNMDNQVIKLNSDNFLEDALQIYSKNVLKKPLKEADKRLYFFFDEIQNLEDWPLKLKNWVDQKLTIKIFITGSSSTNILKGGQESLAGRISPQLILPFKFLEVLRFHYAGKEDKVKLLDESNWRLRDYFKRSLEKNGPSLFFEKLKETKNQLIPIEEYLKIYLNEYILKGGYPGLLKMKNVGDCARALENYVQATIYRDVVQLYEIRNVKTLQALITLVAQDGIRLTSYNRLAAHLMVRIETIESYLEYLKTAFLISESEFYATNLKVKQRNPRKIFFHDSGVRNSILNQVDENLLKDSSELGLIAETIAYDHTKRLMFNLGASKNTNLSYWKNDKEIDIILELKKKPIPIEVKYANQINNKTISEIKEFIQNYKSTFGIILTKDTLEQKEGKVLLIPLWLFLIMC